MVRTAPFVRSLTGPTAIGSWTPDEVIHQLVCAPHRGCVRAHARRIASAVALTLLIAAGFAVPAASAATPQPKVAIIVGPVASSTGYYKSDGDAAYAEARKYTSNVVKVYTPNATWAAAKKAMQGASIVIYMGHGNGFPSPYRWTPWPYSQNGLGLNPKAGGGDSTTQYYGEYYLAKEVKLAPNAIVLLHHLCYASGTPSRASPSPARPGQGPRGQHGRRLAQGWRRSGRRGRPFRARLVRPRAVHDAQDRRPDLPRLADLQRQRLLVPVQPDARGDCRMTPTAAPAATGARSPVTSTRRLTPSPERPTRTPAPTRPTSRSRARRRWQSTERPSTPICRSPPEVPRQRRWPWARSCV